MPLKIAIAGMGGIGNLHGDCYVKDELAEIVAVCDVNKEKADAAAEKFKVPAFYSVKEMLKQVPEIEVVDVTTSGYENGSWHYVPTMEALEANKHVLCEKPLSNDVLEAREMVKYAAEKGLYLGCNLNHYFSEPSFAADKLIEDDKIGAPIYILQKMGFDGSAATFAGKQSPRWQKPYSHVKAFLAHPFAMMRHFNGDITHIQAFFDRPGTRKSANDLMYSINGVNLVFENGSIGYILSQRGDARFGLGGWWSLEMAGTNGTFCIEGCVDKLTYWPGLTPNEAPPPPVVEEWPGAQFNDTFPIRIHCFLEDVTNRVPYDHLRSSGRDALATLEYTFAAIKSFEEGGAVVRPDPLPNMHADPRYVW
jgi:predicted dehydrogenase